MNLTQHCFKSGLHKETILNTLTRFQKEKKLLLPASNSSFKQLSIQIYLHGLHACCDAETEFPQPSVLGAKPHF